jgi:uncharacterized protein (DUF1800 family)
MHAQRLGLTQRLLAAAIAGAFVASCGGGKDDPAAGPAPPGTPPGAPAAAPLSDQEAVRFLTQSTMGATDADIARVKQIGVAAWIEEQLNAPRASHLDFVISELGLDGVAGAQVTMDPLYRSWWKQALTGEDQLRQRVTFALSQIIVASAADAELQNRPAAIAGHLEILSKHAFGNYRDLLDEVTRHPTMGRYLTMLGNRGDNGRVPDENYAREIMQLFSIGLVMLNNDGTPKLVNGAPVDTYTIDDIRGLARVFTGWSWGNKGTPDPSNARFLGQVADRERELLPMQFYPQYHAPEAKTFLGTTIGVGTPGNEALKTALDTVFKHPNVGPFVATRLIQRLVTSNPSPAYVGRVAGIFNNNGQGVRGDMKAVLRAILLDPEARDVGALSATNSGKLREPLLRVTALLRATGAQSESGYFRIQQTDTQLFQTPMRAPTVFNFYRPGFVPPNTDIAAANLVAPEFQITHEVSVANYMNFMQGVVANGIGVVSNNRADVRTQYAGFVELAATPEQLVDRFDLLLTYNSLSAAQRTAMLTAINAITIPAPVVGSSTTVSFQGKTYTKCADEGGTCTFTGTKAVIYGANNIYATKTATSSIGCNNTEFGDPVVGVVKACYAEGGTAPTTAAPPSNQAAIDAAKLNRVRMAAFFTVTAPEFLVQK